MTDNVNVAVIPARSGSRRVPGKNTRLLAGRPAIAYTIDAARQSGLFARIVVTTDSEQVAAIACAHGAEVPFLRSADLSDEHTPVSLATVDAVERLERTGTRADCVAQLMATCPLRTARDVQESYEQFLRTGSSAQLSVTRFAWQNPWWMMHRDAGAVLTAVFGGEITARSQDLPEVFCPTGAIWWARTDALLRERTFHQPQRTGWEIPWQRGVDIDTEEDWRLVELLTCAATA